MVTVAMHVLLSFSSMQINQKNSEDLLTCEALAKDLEKVDMKEEADVARKSYCEWRRDGWGETRGKRRMIPLFFTLAVDKLKDEAEKESVKVVSPFFLHN